MSFRRWISIIFAIGISWAQVTYAQVGGAGAFARKRPIIKLQATGGYVIGPTTTLVIPMPSPVTAGSFLIACVTIDGTSSNIASVGDNRGNTWLLTDTEAFSGIESACYRVVSANAGSTNVTIMASLGTAINGVVYELSGISSTTPVDAVTSTFGTGTNPMVTSPAVTKSNEFVFVYSSHWGPDPTWTPNAGYTIGVQTDPAGVGYYTTSAYKSTTYGLSGTQQPIFTVGGGAGAWVILIQTYRGL